PGYAVLLVAALASLAFVYANVLSVLVAFATGAYYVGFLFPVAALLVVHLRGRWAPSTGPLSAGRWTLPLSIVATAWLCFELVNIAWPRYDELPWWQNWAFVVGIVAFGVVGLVYFLATRPDRRFGTGVPLTPPVSMDNAPADAGRSPTSTTS